MELFVRGEKRAAHSTGKSQIKSIVDRMIEINGDGPGLSGELRKRKEPPKGDGEQVDNLHGARHGLAVLPRPLPMDIQHLGKYEIRRDQFDRFGR